METGTAALNDIEVRYRAAGSGPAVVLVHGLGLDHTSWRRQQRELTEYRTFAYDVRGHGATTLGHADGTLRQLRDDLIAFLTEVSGPAVCVGFSLGGTVVLSAAAARPDLVTGVVAIATSSVVSRVAAEFFRRRADQARTGNLRDALREDTVAMVTNPAVDVDALVERRIAAVGDGRGFANAATAMAGLRADPLTPELANVRQPVTVIGAADDALCPRKAADILLEALPNAAYREIPACGHLMSADNPTALTEELRTALHRR
ncbi:alpha/beta hydrolase [Saccharopolyspora subtropica]|uniref:Alpha/beta hydrolase n=1 Tax=Saccharopolyspora thermophila TaxID=89367 RepID=A0A917K0Q2_9PSEU|nr:alpha/beta hydrolase [Saccharopolyspora subtropica]GGI91519.1 alpha/beta hydrolase [Saccharopolyspora subtropica]